MKPNTMKDNGAENDSVNNKYVLVSFQSSHHAIRGEKVAESAVKDIVYQIEQAKDEKSVRLIPLPPEISAGCGLVLQLPFLFLQTVLDVFKADSIAFEDIFVVECGEKKTYTKFLLE